MTEEEKKNTGFKVKDSRRFTTEGIEKSEVDTPHASPSPTAPKNDRQTTQKIETDSTKLDSPRAERTNVTGEIDFSSFIVSLGTQALMQLGVMKSPHGMEVPVDPLAAKQTIDIIAMLQERTRGNLDEAEVTLVEEILHSVRIRFIQSTTK